MNRTCITRINFKQDYLFRLLEYFFQASWKRILNLFVKHFGAIKGFLFDSGFFKFGIISDNNPQKYTNSENNFYYVRFDEFKLL